MEKGGREKEGNDKENELTKNLVLIDINGPLDSINRKVATMT